MRVLVSEEDEKYSRLKIKRLRAIGRSGAHTHRIASSQLDLRFARVRIRITVLLRARKTAAVQQRIDWRKNAICEIANFA